MIKKSEIIDIVSKYSEPTIGTLGSHSALEIMDGAKDENFKTVVVCQRGREVPYKRFSRLADEIIIVKKFQDMLSPKIQARLRDSSTIVVPHRALNSIFGI